MQYWVLISLCLAACHVQQRRLDEKYGTRLASINQQYDRLAADTRQEWDRISHLADDLRREAVPLDQAGLPYDPVRAKYQAAHDSCGGQVDCERNVVDSYVADLHARYYLADFTTAFTEINKPDNSADLEVLLAQSHNEVLDTKLRDFDQRVSDGLIRALGGIEGAREAEIMNAAADRMSEIEQQNTKRKRAIAAVAAGLSAYGRALQQPSVVDSNAFGAMPQQRGCTSDFSCGIGFACVKQNYQTLGVCMRAVNEFGAPSFSGPRTGSIGPNIPSPNSCSQGGVCPVGFRCDFNTSTCIR